MRRGQPSIQSCRPSHREQFPPSECSVMCLKGLWADILWPNVWIFYGYFIMLSCLSAFRKKYGCHHVLIKMIEDWKSALDRGENAGSILMDLSKAFHCLLHRLLLTKLHAYGVSNESRELIKHYLMGRQQCVKIGIVKKWLVWTKERGSSRVHSWAIALQYFL